MRLLYLFLGVSFITFCFSQTPHSQWDRREFVTLYGKRADPCHIDLTGPFTQTDCNFNQNPDPSQTIVVPPVGGPPFTTIPAAAVAINAFVISGHRIFNGRAVGSTLDFALSDSNGLCASIDGTTIVTSNALAALTKEDSVTVPAATLYAAGWMRNSMLFEANPRSICFRDTGLGNPFIYTGFKWQVVYAVLAGAINPCPPTVAAATAAAMFPMNDTWALMMLAKTATCKNTASAQAIAYAQCQHPTAEACCGGVLYNPATQKCCNPIVGIVQWMDGTCPCYLGGVTVPQTQCPSTEPLCCLPTKYPELTYTELNGECYNSTTHQCCDTGHRFDAGSRQCCVINGLQSLDTQCPCTSAQHCRGNLQDPNDDGNFTCCIQDSAQLYEAAYLKTSIPATPCNTYANFPQGTGPFDLQNCVGVCLDTRYQTCCNGATCVTNTEYCCNSTCCNRYVGTCQTGRRPGTRGKWSNGNDFGVFFTQCSTIEQLNTIKAFWIFVLPTELMFASFFCLAMALAFAARAKDSHEYVMIERIIVLASVIAILFCVTTFFAPIYKYGVVVVIVSLVAIINAAARVKWLNVLCVIFQIVALLYLFDFVDGNFYLGLNSNRNFITGVTDMQTMGVLHSIKKMWPSPNLVKDQFDVTTSTYQRSWCTTYYNYFRFDVNIRDTERYDNSELTTFGYCSRAWALALYLFVAAIMDLVILQFILSFLALIIRFKRHPVELEIVPVDEAEEENFKQL